MGVVAADRSPQQAGERLRRPAGPGALGGGDLGAVRPQQLDRHPPLGQRPGLVRADHVSRAERLDCRQPLDQRAAARHPPDADREREGDRRQQALGHVRDEQPDREGERIVERQPGDRDPHGQEDDARDHRDRSDQLRGIVDLDLKRADLGLDPLRQRCDAAELRAHARRVDDGLGLARRAEAAAEHQVLRFEPAGSVSRGAGAPYDGLRFARQRGHVDLDAAFDQAGVR